MKPSILVLEDSPSMVFWYENLVRDELENLGLQQSIRVLSDISRLEEEVLTIRRDLLACVILDLSFPWSQRISQYRATPNYQIDGILSAKDEWRVECPIVITSGTGLMQVLDGDKVRALKAMDVTIIDKPFRYITIAEKLFALLGTKNGKQ